ncbi:hypothetical protein niasHT_024048 [Heterodera trifolii]|uniref:Uncharacterized protein n=1 Tax=Heterodera trifolii TaxID=157864 RepID=A0ABD2JYM9_9BILA
MLIIGIQMDEHNAKGGIAQPNVEPLGLLFSIPGQKMEANGNNAKAEEKQPAKGTQKKKPTKKPFLMKLQRGGRGKRNVLGNNGGFAGGWDHPN